MNAREDFTRLLQQWRRLTRAESEAIGASAWTKLQEIQAQKTALHPAMDEAFKAWQAVGATENPFRDDLARLIALEAHNAQLLSDRRKKAREQQRVLEQASQNLGKVRRTYATAPLAAAWNSYS